MAHATRADVMLMTADEFLLHSVPDAKAELVRGELRVTPPAGGPHACVQSNLLARLIAYVEPRGLGRVFGDGAGYLLLELPHTVRVPDASFVRSDRFPAEGIGPGLLRFAPDLAVEVLSPSESASELDEKLEDYRACGTPLIWVVDPARRTVMIVANDAPVRWLSKGDTLDGGEILPGFSCEVVELFQGLAETV